MSLCVHIYIPSCSGSVSAVFLQCLGLSSGNKASVCDGESSVRAVWRSA